MTRASLPTKYRLLLDLSILCIVSTAPFGYVLIALGVGVLYFGFYELIVAGLVYDALIPTLYVAGIGGFPVTMLCAVLTYVHFDVRLHLFAST